MTRPTARKTRKLGAEQKKLEDAIKVLRLTWREIERVESCDRTHAIEMANIKAIIDETRLSLGVMLSAAQDAVKAHKSGSQTRIELAMDWLDKCIWETKHCSGEPDDYETTEVDAP